MENQNSFLIAVGIINIFLWLSWVFCIRTLVKEQHDGMLKRMKLPLGWFIVSIIPSFILVPEAQILSIICNTIVLFLVILEKYFGGYEFNFKLMKIMYKIWNIELNK